MDGPAGRTDGAPEGSKKQGLAVGFKAQHNHVKTIRKVIERFAEAHFNSRIFVAVQSGYSDAIAFMFENNLGTDYPKMKEAFITACCQRAGRLVVADLREELLGIGDPVLVAKVIERILQLFQAEGLIGPKLAELMRKCVAGGDRRDEGEQSEKCFSNQHVGVNPVMLLICAL